MPSPVFSGWSACLLLCSRQLTFTDSAILLAMIADVKQKSQKITSKKDEWVTVVSFFCKQKLLPSGIIPPLFYMFMLSFFLDWNTLNVTCMQTGFFSMFWSLHSVALLGYSWAKVIFTGTMWIILNISICQSSTNFCCPVVFRQCYMLCFEKIGIIWLRPNLIQYFTLLGNCSSIKSLQTLILAHFSNFLNWICIISYVVF